MVRIIQGQAGEKGRRLLRVPTFVKHPRAGAHGDRGLGRRASSDAPPAGMIAVK
ncbi:hypothetical protein ACQPYK_29335 [Streptosporangium sp. CA-135522]|uniref:hypothetical protein n=1 Tax=Streptosporangium sp. CA-135522 TaxID=3240072 RepID=UPI003D8A978F